MIQLNPTNLIAVEVPEDPKYRIWENHAETPFNSYLVIEDDTYNNYHRIGNFKVKYLGEVTKNGVQFDGEPYIGIHIVNKTKYYYNYLPFEGMDFRDIIDNSFKTSQESFQSLLQANNVEISEGKKLLILLKR